MLNINAKFSPNGSRLFYKITNQLVDKEKSSFLANIENLSNKAKTFDLASLERDFGQNSVQIFSFKDAAGKIIQKIQKTTGKDDVLKVRTYSNSENFGNHIKKIEQTVYKNGELVQEKFDNICASVIKHFFRVKWVVAKTSFNRDIVKDSNIKANERSLYGVFKTKTAPKKIIAIAQRNQDNSVKLNGIQYSGITKDKAKELAQDPYLTMRLLPTGDFLSTIKHKVYRDHDLTKAQIKTYKVPIPNEDVPGTNCFNIINGQARRNRDGSIVIYFNKNDVILNSKSEIVETFNHEAQHCRQYIYVEQLEYTQNFPYCSPNSYVGARQKTYGVINDKETLKYAEAMKVAFFNKIISKNSEDAYYNNGLEVDARAAGKKAKDEYISFANKLQSVIPLTDKQIGL